MNININNFKAELKNNKSQLFFHIFDNKIEIDTVYLTDEYSKHSDEARRMKVTYIEKSGTMGVIHLFSSHDMISRFDLMMVRIKKFIETKQAN